MEAFPEDVERFLNANIGSVEQLEILRILAGDRGRLWAVADLAGLVQASAGLGPHLATLKERGLLLVGGPEPLYRYGAATPELAALLERLLQMYNERPVTMIRMVYARANPALQAFADAFRLKKDG